MTNHIKYFNITKVLLGASTEFIKSVNNSHYQTPTGLVVSEQVWNTTPLSLFTTLFPKATIQYTTRPAPTNAPLPNKDQFFWFELYTQSVTISGQVEVEKHKSKVYSLDFTATPKPTPLHKEKYPTTAAQIAKLLGPNNHDQPL